MGFSCGQFARLEYHLYAIVCDEADYMYADVHMYTDGKISFTLARHLNVDLVAKDVNSSLYDMSTRRFEFN